MTNPDQVVFVPKVKKADDVSIIIMSNHHFDYYLDHFCHNIELLTARAKYAVGLGHNWHMTSMFILLTMQD